MKKVFIIIFLFVSVTTFSQEVNDYNYQYALTEAARQKVIGNLEDAILLYKKCIEANAQSSVAYYELGSIYASLKEPDLAEEYLRNAYEREPGNYWYVDAYDQILKNNKKHKQAVKICKEYLKKDNDTRILLNIAESLDAEGKFKKALGVLNDIEKHNGVSEMVTLKKVELYKKTGNFAEGREELMKLREMIPEAPEYNILLAEYLDETGDKDGAVKYYLEAFNLDSTNVYAITNLADYYNRNGFTKEGYFFLSKAFSLDEIGVDKKINTMMFFLKNDSLMSTDTKEIGLLIDELSMKYPDNYDINTIAYDFYNKTEQLDKAYSVIQNLLKQKYDNYILWQQALYNASRLGKFDDMIKFGQEAIKYFPNKPELKLFVGIAWFQKGGFENSYDVLKSGFTDELESGVKAQYLTFLGESAYKLEKYKDSFGYFEKLLLLEPDNDLVKNNYSYYMALTDINLQRARELSEETVLREPENGTYLDTYGWVLYKSGDFARAKEYLEKAIKYSAENSEIFYHYAEVLYELGDKDSSLAYFEKAKESGLNNDEVNQRIRELKHD